MFHVEITGVLNSMSMFVSDKGLAQIVLNFVNRKCRSMSEQYCQVLQWYVQAEEINSDTPVSRWLRAHRGESKFWGNPIETL